MEIIKILLAIVYLTLLIVGFKSTWHLAVNGILAGSSGIVFPIILFVLMILVVGRLWGLLTW